MINCRKTIAFLLFFSLMLLVAASAIWADSKDEAALEWKKVRSSTNQGEVDPAVAKKAASQAKFEAELEAFLEAQAEYDAKLEAYLLSETKPPAEQIAEDAKVAPELGARPLYEPRVSVILSEGFESAVPPAGWSTVITNGGATFNWYQGTAAFEGTYSAQILYDPALVPQDEWLISPSMDLTSVTSDIRVEFYWTMSYYWGIDPFDNYDLELWISTDGGSSFPTLLWDESSEGVFTSFTFYKTAVSLAAYIGESDIVLAWRYVGSDGAQGNVDFVNVTDDAPPVLGPGDNCDDPEKIDLPSDLPFAHTSLTCGRGNDYSETCLGFYDGGEDMTYEITVTSTVTVDITLDPLGTTYVGFLLDDACPADGSCITFKTNSSSSSPFTAAGVTLDPGVYYLMVDTWPTPDCIPEFDVIITEAAPAEPGDNCSNPIAIEIPSLPYSDNGQTTCGHGDNYDATCLGSYDGGEDILYELTVLSEVTVDIILDPLGTTYTGILIDDVCPPGGTGECIDFSSSSGGGSHGMTDLTLSPGTYYIMVDTWPSPDCIPEFDLSIFESSPAEPGDNCSNPLKIDIPALPYSDLGQTTCGRGDNYDATCLSSYDGGEDIIYEVTVLSPVVVDITLDPLGTAYTGILISDVCPPEESCLGCSSNSGTEPHTIYAVDLAPGTYYIMVDTWPSPECIPSFDLHITEAAPPPANDNWEDAEKVDDLTDYPFCTAGASFDGNGDCSTCPNVWYCYTATCDGRVTVDLCGSSYDTYLSVYDGCGEPLSENLIACNDDACGLQSGIQFFALAGNEYLIEVGGYGGGGCCNAGCGDISISCSVPCQVECPTGASDEGELCGTDTNGGCNSETPTFYDIQCGETVCGDGWAEAGFRDTDWYRVTLDGFYEVTWTVQAEFEALIGPLESNAPGSGNCADLTGLISPAAFPGECEVGSVTVTLGPGVHFFFVAPSVFSGYPCSVGPIGPFEYYATLTCVPAEADYCAASGGCDEHIVNVTVGAINNNSACEGYGDFTGLSTAMTIGDFYPISVTNGVLLYSADECGVHVDWNQDMDFDDADEFIAMAGSPGVGPYTASIVPPEGALEGPTRMRVRLTYAQAPTACGSHSYGEVEDYTVVVEAGSSELQMQLDPDPIFAAMGRPIDPRCVDIYVGGEALPGYPVNAINLNAMNINASNVDLPAVQAEILPSYPDFSGEVLHICVDMASFVNAYGILYNSTTQTYTVEGEMNDATPFSISDDFTYRGHIAGDVNLDESVNILDLTFLVDLRFRGGPMFEDPVEADVNADGAPGNIIDLTYLVSHFFRGGPPPLHLDQ